MHPRYAFHDCLPIPLALRSTLSGSRSYAGVPVDERLVKPKLLNLAYRLGSIPWEYCFPGLVCARLYGGRSEALTDLVGMNRSRLIDSLAVLVLVMNEVLAVCLAVPEVRQGVRSWLWSEGGAVDSRRTPAEADPRLDPACAMRPEVRSGTLAPQDQNRPTPDPVEETACGSVARNPSLGWTAS